MHPMSSRADTAARNALLERCEAILQEEEILREGGGKIGQDRQREKGRLPARERIAHLLDRDAPFFEIGLWAAYKMYEQWGSVPAAGAVAGIGSVHGIPCMIIANDATVKAGAFFPQTAK
jgi:acetyl-CoA carboxylase carboxyltransferase component